MSDASRLRTTKTGFKSAIQLSAIALAAAIAAACGGGGVGSEGTGISAGYSSGTVSGFGSVIVNGVHYDLSASTDVRGDDDVSGPTGDSNRGVKIGMEVEIESGRVNCTTTTGETVCRANATSVSWGTEFKGPIVGNPAGGSFEILGQTVLINDATIFIGRGAIDTKAKLAAGQIVEVHGRYNRATNELTATLIEVKAADLASFDGEFRFAGELTAFTAFTPANGATPAVLGSATVAGVSLEINAGTEVRGATVGKRVRVRIDPSVTPTTPANWVADRIRSAGRDLRDHAGREGEIKGVTSGFVLNTAGTVASFLVDGMPVSVARADVSDAAWTVVLGLESAAATVEVEGRIESDGVLTVRKVELEDDDQFEIELTGTLTFSGNTLTIGDHTFDFNSGGVELRLNGTSVTVDAAGVLSRFANGQRVEVKGLLQPDGITVKLVRIKRED